MMTLADIEAMEKFVSANPDCAHYFVRYAKEQVLCARHEGVACPACEQYLQVHIKTVTASQVVALTRLYACKPTKNFHHLREWGDVSNNIYALEFWGLVESLKHIDDPIKVHMGYWRITEKGILFLRGKAKIAQSITLYLNDIESVDDSVMVDVHDAFGEKFSLKNQIFSLKG